MGLDESQEPPGRSNVTNGTGILPWLATGSLRYFLLQGHSPKPGLFGIASYPLHRTLRCRRYRQAGPG